VSELGPIFAYHACLQLQDLRMIRLFNVWHAVRAEKLPASQLGKALQKTGPLLTHCAQSTRYCPNTPTFFSESCDVRLFTGK